MIHENIDISGSLSISGSLKIPKHASTSDATTATASLYHDTTDNVMKIYTGTEWVVVGEQTAGSSVSSTDIEYLLVAGGGAGGNTYSYGVDGGGGGGAGGLLSSSLASVESGSSFTVTVGAGGSQATNAQGGAGVDSSIAGATISTITATGGGGGGGYSTNSGGNGGSGGGSTNAGAAGSGTVGQGNDGYGGGGNANGGGGATQAGGVDQSPNGGQGGSGSLSNITGTSTGYAGGGSGGSDSSTSTYTAGGYGGGGSGAAPGASLIGGNGTSNTGGGGGGGSANDSYSNGGAGGSGVAIFAYDSGSVNAAGGIVGDVGNGRKYNQFNSSGTFKVGSTSDFQIVTSNLVSHFDAGDFASRGTSTWTDLSGNGYNLTAASSPSLGNNFYYDFSTSYFTRTDSAHEFTNGNFTVEVWVKFDSLSAGDTIASKRSTGNPGDRNWLLGHDANGLVYFIQYHSSSQNTYPQTGNGVITTGTWYHIAVTGDASTMKIYVNGSQEASTSFTTTGVWGTGSPLELARRGTNSGYQYLDGQIAQFRAYSSGLSAAEITQNYNATKTNFV